MAFEVAPVYATRKKYKPVDKKIVLVKTTLPDGYRIIRRAHPNPLGDMPTLPTHPPDFSPGRIYTLEWYEQHNANPDGFLWPDKVKLVHHLVRVQEDAFAWTELEKGKFKDEYFAPILIPTIKHVPWVLRNIPILPGIYSKVIDIIRDKIALGVYEDSNASYRSRWFCVPKKDGMSLRLVHDLQPLNQVTIRDSAVPLIALCREFRGLGVLWYTRPFRIL
jgi:hypothetical protein